MMDINLRLAYPPIYLIHPLSVVLLNSHQQTTSFPHCLTLSLCPFLFFSILPPSLIRLCHAMSLSTQCSRFLSSSIHSSHSPTHPSSHFPGAWQKLRANVLSSQPPIYPSPFSRAFFFLFLFVSSFYIYFFFFSFPIRYLPTTLAIFIRLRAFTHVCVCVCKYEHTQHKFIYLHILNFNHVHTSNFRFFLCVMCVKRWRALYGYIFSFYFSL